MENGASSYRRYLDGDKNAFDQILTEYWTPLVQFISGFVHDSHAAQDIAMDVFADLIVSPRRYDFRVSLKSYLFMLGRSRALNALKRKKRIPFTTLEEAIQAPSGEPAPEEQLLAASRNQALRAAVDALEPKLREAVYLCYLEELSCEEAARVMGKTRKQVYNYLYRGKARLRAILEKEDIS